MRTLSRERLLFAGLTFVVVFGSYVFTMAPTLTFWDAGEFISTAFILGIPHPPGTPLFILMGHVFGSLPLGIAYAVKLNLMSALASATGGFFYFLVVAQILGRIDRRGGWNLPDRFIEVGALGAVALSAWGLTVWHNSIETEVYTVAMMTIALVTFLVFYWADHLEQGKDWNLLLLVVFLMGLSVGNHLMALLVMPAVVVYGAIVVWDRYRGYVPSLVAGALGLYLVVMRGLSIDGLISGGPAVNPLAMLVGLAVLGGALYWMSRTGALTFFFAAAAVFAAGASVIFYLKIRAGLGPSINEANPETWKELLAVLGRKQYDVRPVFPRSVDFVRHQIPLYFDYLFGVIGPFESRVPGQFGTPLLSVGVAILAAIGSAYHFMADRKTWVYFLLLFLATSLGLILYLNFPLGNTQEPSLAGVAREVRERDYFFVVSYVFLGLWAGVGGFALLGSVWKRKPDQPFRGLPLAGALASLLILPVVVFALNHHESDRRGNYIPRDFAYNVLQSVEPWAILFTNGDNDTFPLWYLQEVEGVRKDVSVVNLALMNTTWYIRQIKETAFTATDPPANRDDLEYDLAGFGVEAGPRPTETLIDFTGTPDDPLYRIGFLIDEPVVLDVAGLEVALAENSVLRRQDVGVLQVVRKHLGRRPIYFSVTVPGDGKVGLDAYLLREGIVDRLLDRTSESYAAEGNAYLPMQPPERSWINVERTALLLENVYEYRGVLDASIHKSDTGRALVGNYGATFLQLAAAQARQGDTEAAIPILERGQEVLGRSPDDDQYLSSLINVHAVSGRFEGIDSLLHEGELRKGDRLDDRYYKTAAYNAAVAGHLNVADRLLEKYFRLNRTAVEPELWIEISEMALAADDTTQAMKFLTRAIRVDPDNQRAFLRYVNLALDIGNEILARTFLYQWVKSHPGDTATAEMYEDYLDSGVFPEALRWENVVQGVGSPVDTSAGGG